MTSTVRLSRILLRNLKDFADFFSFQENKIFKKILWKVSDLSEEAIRNYEAGKKIESPPFTIQLGGNVLTW